MKTSMGKDTILFVTKQKGGVAFNINYYRNNFDKFSNMVSDPERIFYKMGETYDSWIDFKRAIQTKTGSYQERLDKAFADPLYHITDLRELPETVYYDEKGYIFNIPPYDGNYASAFWLKSVKYDYEAVSFKFVGDDLVAQFSEADNITNAIVSLNALFHHYEVLAYNKIVFKNIKPILPRINTIGDEIKQFATRIQAYAWEGLHKEEPVFPKKRDNEWFILQRPIEQNCFIIYKSVMYEYELHPTDARKFKLKNVTLTSLPFFSLDEIYVYRMNAMEQNHEARKYISRGVGNKYKNTVDFALPIENSMILFNGVDNEFEVQDVASIFYPESIFSVRHVSNLSFIAQINFMLG